MGQTGFIHRLENGIGSIAAHNHRRPAIALVIALILTAAGVFGSRSLRLNADLVALLPQSFQSVRDLDKLRQHFGGMGYVVVAGLGAEQEQLQQFAEDMAPGLEKLPEARFVEFKRATDFFEKRAMYYLELDDLQTIRKRIKARMSYERRERNPMFIKLDDEDKAPSVDFADIESKYAGSSSKRLAGKGETYFIDPAQKMIVLLMKPMKDSADLGYAKRVTGDVDAFMKTQDLKKYGPNFTWAITGNYKKKVDQQQEIASDLATASIFALVGLLLYLFFHFRSLYAVGFTLASVMAGLTWTYGWVGSTYGSVNLLTGFLGAILGGLGVEHGIHLYGRYSALRDEGQSSEDSIRESFRHTGFSAVISSMVASLTFLSLAISEFRAFREFGVIAAVGMMVAIAGYILIFPALIGVAAKFGWKPRSHAESSKSWTAIAQLLPRFYKPIAIGAAVILFVLVIAAPKVRFNFDFAALDDADLPSVKLDKKIDKILGYSQTPVIVLTEKHETEREVAAKLVKRKAELGPSSTIDFIAALSDLVPTQQEEKQVVIKEIGDMLSQIDPDKFDADTKASIERAKASTETAPFTRADIPMSVRRQFEGSGGAERGFVLVFSKVSLSDGANVRRFAQEVRAIQLDGGEQMSAAGEAMILADILDMVTKEAPEVLIASVLSVVIAMWITMGKLRDALLCLMPTILSILALAGLMAITGTRFNYLNIIVVPVLIGTTVDAGVHLVSRLREAGSDFVSIYAETGRSIAGGLLTSAVGFAALVLAHHPGLNSVGDLAILGFAINFVIILFGFPAFLYYRRQQAGGNTAAPAA